MIIITGHSLGAAEACLYAFDRVSRGLPVDALYTFGCPQPGNAAVGAGLNPIPAWRPIQNSVGPHFPELKFDLVTAVPFEAPGFDYTQPRPFETISEEPPPDDSWGLFRYHHSQLYQAGVRKLTPLDGQIIAAIDFVQQLYDGTGNWETQHFIDGQYWGVQRLEGAKVLVFRGSKTALDWHHDFDFRQEPLHGARVSAGFWAGPAASLEALDAALA